MNSKETTPRLLTTFLCISLLFVFFQCTSSQPVSTNFLTSELNDNGNSAGPIWMPTLSNSNSDESNSEENNSQEWLQAFLHNEQNKHNRAGLSSPVRRANFWKRANFWRKRANFWRRDLAA